MLNNVLPSSQVVHRETTSSAPTVSNLPIDLLAMNIMNVNLNNNNNNISVNNTTANSSFKIKQENSFDIFEIIGDNNNQIHQTNNQYSNFNTNTYQNNNNQNRNSLRYKGNSF